jgi:hypothetical protein
MKKYIIYALLFATVTVAKAQFDFKKVVKEVGKDVDKDVKVVKEEVKKVVDPPKGLSNEDVISGLKEALSVGTNNSSGTASQLDGFNKNPKIKIPFPQEAIDMKTKLDKLGMQKQTDKFVETLNRGAEEAAKSAAPIFLDAIKNMSVGDGFAILNGKDTAATSYLKGKTTNQLTEAFKPKVKEALQKVNVTKYWTPLMTTYNKVPGVKKQNPDLNNYVTNKAMEGLFALIADEEIKIRKDPAARVTDILKKVFEGKK